MTLVAACCLVGLIGGCKRGGGEPSASTRTVIVVKGSTALQPLLAEASQRFMATHPDVDVRLAPSGSLDGLAEVLSGTATIGASDEYANTEQARSLTDHRIAVLGFAVMAHRGPYNEAIASLSQAQLQGIFSGKIRNWSQVGGGNQAISVINRRPNSGSRALVADIILRGDHFLQGVPELDSSTEVQEKLLSQAGAISYIALPFRNDRLKVFAYEGVAPSTENIVNGNYWLFAYEHLYTKGAPTPAAAAFIDYILAAPFQNETLPRLNFIPVASLSLARGGGAD
jgi:phosphate transport system substrate-binding protein